MDAQFLPHLAPSAPEDGDSLRDIMVEEEIQRNPSVPMHPDRPPVELPPPCMLFYNDQLEAIRCVGGDPTMFPQPEAVLDALQDAADRSPDEMTEAELTGVLMQLEMCALLSEDEINEFGFMYHSCLRNWRPFETDVPTDCDVWLKQNRAKWGKYREEHSDD